MPKPKDWVTVIGVVEDVKQMGMADQPRDTVYQLSGQMNRAGWISHMAFVVRTVADPESFALGDAGRGSRRGQEPAGADHRHDADSDRRIDR